MILVTGATGQLGRLVISALLKEMPANEIVAAVRNPNKAEDLTALGVQVRHADYDEPATLDAALAGVDKVLLISSNEIGQRIAQHRAVIDAAVRAGVKLLAYTSVLHADTSPLMLAEEHRQTEAALRDSGLPFVLLRNGWYTENYTAGIPTALEHGVMLGSAGEGKISSATRAEFAEAAAKVLTSPEEQAGRVYELAGDTSYTRAELAAQVARQSGKPVVYQDVPEAAYNDALLSVGLPAEVAHLLSDSDSGVSKNALFDESGQLSRLIGKPTAPLSAAIGEALKS